MGMLSVVSECLPGPKVSPNSPRYTNCTCCDSRTISCAPFFIALSSSGNRYDNVSRESSVHSMISISSPLIKSINPIASSSQQVAVSSQLSALSQSAIYNPQSPVSNHQSAICNILHPDVRRSDHAVPELRR